MRTRIALAALTAMAAIASNASAATVEYTVSSSALPTGISFTGNAGSLNASQAVTFGTFSFSAGLGIINPVAFTLTVLQTAPNGGSGSFGGSISGFIATPALGTVEITFLDPDDLNPLTTPDFDIAGAPGHTPVSYSLAQNSYVGTGPTPINVPITGFVDFTSSAAPVPVPPAVMAGFALLGGLGLVKGRSKIAALLR